MDKKLPNIKTFRYSYNRSIDGEVCHKKVEISYSSPTESQAEHT